MSGPDALPDHRPWTFAILLMLANTLSFIDRQIVGLLVEPIKADLHLSDTQIGLLYGLGFTLFYIAAAIPVAQIADRASRKLVVVASIASWSVATALCGLSRSFETFLAARIGVGVGEGGLTPSALSLLADLFPRDRLATAIALYQAGVYLGNALALILGGIVAHAVPPSTELVVSGLGIVRGWQLPFLLLLAPGLVLALVLLRMREPPRRAPDADGERRPAALLPQLRARAPVYAAIMGGFALLVLGGNGAQFWTPALVQRSFDWPTHLVGHWLGWTTLAFGATGVLAGGMAADRLARRAPAAGPAIASALGMAGMVPLAFAFPLLPTPGTMLAAVAAHQWLSAFALSGGMATLQTITPTHMRARVLALQMVLINLAGTLAGPTLIGMLADRIGAAGGGLAMAMALIGGGSGALAAMAMAIAARSCRSRAATIAAGA